MSALKDPISKSSSSLGSGVRAVVVAPTRELAHQIHNECLKLAQGRKWRIVLLSKATASTLAEKTVRDKVGELFTAQRLSIKAQAFRRCHRFYPSSSARLTEVSKAGARQVSRIFYQKEIHLIPF